MIVSQCLHGCFPAELATLPPSPNPTSLSQSYQSIAPIHVSRSSQSTPLSPSIKQSPQKNSRSQTRMDDSKLEIRKIAKKTSGTILDTSAIEKQKIAEEWGINRVTPQIQKYIDLEYIEPKESEEANEEDEEETNLGIELEKAEKKGINYPSLKGGPKRRRKLQNVKAAQLKLPPRDIQNPKWI